MITISEGQRLLKSWSKYSQMKLLNLTLIKLQRKLKVTTKNRAIEKTLLKRWKNSKVIEVIKKIREESRGQTFEFPERIDKF
jgi:hypothetical protein